MDNKKGRFARLGQWGPFSAVSERIRNKLLVSLLGLALLPLIVLGLVSHLISSGALMDQAFDGLRAAETNKSIAVSNHFEGRRGDMNALVDTANTLRSKAFDQLASMQRLKKTLVESYFMERMNDVRVMGESPSAIEALRAFERVSAAVGGPSWREVEQAHGPYFVEFNDAYAYYDTYLVSADGTVLYSVAQKADLGTNLLTGDLSESPAGKAFQKGTNGVAFQDFEPYAPAETDAAAFVAAPIRSGDRVQGVILVQVSVDQIDFIMQERTGMGRSGETYLVGPDRLFRSNSIHIAEPTVINPAFVVDTEGVNQALAGESGQGVTINYRGEYVLSSWTPVRIQDVQWAMVAEIDVTEAFVPGVGGEEPDFFTQYAREYDYADLGLLNPDGYLFYTVDQGLDFRTNMLTGPYKDTNLGRLVRRVLDTRAFGMADFAPYAPSDNRPAAFYAMPIIFDDQVELVVFARLSADIIDRIMSQRAGQGETAESYLVGPDNLWRSNSRFLEQLGVQSTVLNPEVPVDTPAARRALAGETGTEVIRNYQGRKVLSSYAPMTVFPPTEANPEGVRWAVISEIGYDEVRQPILNLAGIGLLILVLVGALVVFGALLLSRGLTRQVDHINTTFEEIGMGNFKARAPVTSNDELGEMAESLNAMLDNTLALIQSSEERDAMQSSIMRLLEEISGLAEGDLTVRAEVTEDFTGAIADSFNEMAEQLGRVVRNVKDVTIQVSATSRDVSASTENLARTSETQSSQVSQAIAAIDAMAASIGQVAQNASRSTGVSEQSTKHAKEGAEAVRRTTAAMESIRDHVQETARAIKRLGESSQEVGNIVQLINDIADRTSILALNASIQAAMAGEAGRGFAVVAEEVQRLAERSTNATKQIDTLIKNIQGEINEAGTSMEESIQRVVEGSRLADDAYGKLQEIESVTGQLGELIQSISKASKQQAEASKEIAHTMGTVGEISSQTSSASRQTAIAMRHLSDASDQLNESVSVFKLEAEQPPAEEETGMEEESEEDQSAA